MMKNRIQKNIAVVLFSLTITWFFSQNEIELRYAFKQSYNEEKNLKYTKAIEILMPFSSFNSYEINMRLAWLHYSNAKFKEASDYYKKAIDFAPKSLDAKLGYVYTLAALEKWEAVIEQYKAIITLDPAHSIANYNLALIYFNRNEYKNGLSYINNYVSYYPFNFDGLNLVGWFYFNLGNKSQAINYFKKALLLNPDVKLYDEILNEKK